MRCIRWAFVTCAVLAGSLCLAQNQDEFLTDVPAYPGNVILARPTDHSITLSIMTTEPRSARIDFGLAGKAMDRHSREFKLDANEPREIILDSLAADSGYEFQVIDMASGKPIFPAQNRGAFHTQRSKAGAFTFTIQADSHLDGACRPDLYKLCLANVLADKPDFHIDLGDTFMTGKHATRASALQQYLAQRYYFGLIGNSSPVFFVIGNHDGEEAKKRGATEPGGLAAWAVGQRKKYFANPVPDSFYTGDEESYPSVGLLHDYYSFTWGDALFVMLNPYWTSSASRGTDAGWNMSLGKEQHAWLGRTLKSSDAKYKFVFIHQLVGGLDKSGRGGAEAAMNFEWGGHEMDGTDTFAKNRPTFSQPIERMLVETHVTAVFHGHDHFYAHQEHAGIVYQLVPQPAHRNFVKTPADEYGYKSGTIFPNSGHVRVRVAPEGVEVDYIHSATPEMARRNVENGAVADHYRIRPAP